MKHLLFRVGGYAVIVGLAGCATSVQVPQIPLLSENFTAARRIAEPEPPVKIVTVPEVFPLPGQLKPVVKRAVTAKDETPPKDRIASANAAARREPVKDGYINAIQVYPFAKGALYQVYAAVNQVTDIALEAGEKLTSVSAGDTLRWVVGDTTSGDHLYGLRVVDPSGFRPDRDEGRQRRGQRGSGNGG